MAEGQGKILIIKPAPSHAPDWVQVLWVGCVMPCGHKDPESGDYLVEHEPGIEALKAMCKMTAVEWWHKNGFPERGEYFLFPRDCVYQVTPVSERAM